MPRLKTIRFELILAILIITYIGYFSFFSIARHRNFYTSYYDLGIMDQTVYNTSRGRLLDLTDPTGTKTIKRMAIHNDVILALLAPLYFIYRGPETLLFVQAIISGLGAIFVYLLAQKVLKNRTLSLIFAFAYLMYPPLQWSNLYDFHAVILATTFLLASFYFLIEEKFRLAFITLFLANICKEQIAATTAFLGLFIIGKYTLSLRPKFSIDTASPFLKAGLMVFILGICWFILQVWVIIPHFRGSAHFAIDRYSDFGSTPTSVLLGIVTKPDLIMKLLSEKPVLPYLFLLLSPVGFLSLFSLSIFLIATPELLINILSNNPNMIDIIHQYTAGITPFIFISAIFGAQFLLDKFSRLSAKYIAIYLLAAVFLASFFNSPLPYSKKADIAPFAKGPLESYNYEVNFWQRILENENLTVTATDSLAVQFSDRKKIFRFSNQYDEADYVVLFVDEATDDWYDTEGSRLAYERLQTDHNFKLEYKKGNLEVYKKI